MVSGPPSNRTIYIVLPIIIVTLILWITQLLVTAQRRHAACVARGNRRTCLTCLVSQRSCASRRPKLGRCTLDRSRWTQCHRNGHQADDGFIYIYIIFVYMLIENRCFSERRTCYVAMYCDSIGYRF